MLPKLSKQKIQEPKINPEQLKSVIALMCKSKQGVADLQEDVMKLKEIENFGKDGYRHDKIREALHGTSENPLPTKFNLRKKPN